MRKIIIMTILLVGGFISFCACDNSSVDTGQTDTSVITNEVTYNEKHIFDVKVPEGWKLQGELGKHLIIGYKTKGVFNKAMNPHWELKAENVQKDETMDQTMEQRAKKLAEAKKGSYIGTVVIDGVEFHQVDYKSETFIQKEYLGQLIVRTSKSETKYYNIDFTLKNCPDNFYETAIKILEGISFI